MEISATLKCKSKTRKSTLGCKACTQGKKYGLQGYMFAGTFVFHKSCWVSHTTEWTKKPDPSRWEIKAATSRLLSLEILRNTVGLPACRGGFVSHWYGELSCARQLVRMPPSASCLEKLWARLTGKRPWAHPRHTGGQSIPVRPGLPRAPTH